MLFYGIDMDEEGHQKGFAEVDLSYWDDYAASNPEIYFQDLPDLDEEEEQAANFDVSDSGIDGSASECSEAAVGERCQLAIGTDLQKGDQGVKPLGLKLTITSAVINFINRSISKKKCSNTVIYNNDRKSEPISEKLKALNFSASKIRIGSWERVSQNEGELVAKCYFAKKKLVWEILKAGLKSKIEVQWSDILAIRATMIDEEPGILEIELSQPPTFFHETDPKPRKHTMWHPSADFTNGQASSHRRHKLQFPPGTLDKHYEKLIQSDKRLFELSQGPFPSLNTDLFQRLGGFSLHFNASDPGLRIPQTVPRLVPPYSDVQAAYYPLTMVPFNNTINSDDRNLGVQDRAMARECWNPMMNNLVDGSLTRSIHVAQPSPLTALGPQVLNYQQSFCCENDQALTYGQANTHICSCNHQHTPEQIQATGIMLALPEEANVPTHTGLIHTQHRPQHLIRMGANISVSNQTYGHFNDDKRHFYAHNFDGYNLVPGDLPTIPGNNYNMLSINPTDLPPIPGSNYDMAGVGPSDLPPMLGNDSYNPVDPGLFWDPANAMQEDAATNYINTISGNEGTVFDSRRS